LHADRFGHFALEFEIPVLRHLGAFPVFYIPRRSKTSTGLEDLAYNFVGRLAEIYILLDRMGKLEDALKNHVGMEHAPLIIKRGKRKTRSRCSYGGADDIFSSLTASLDSVGDLGATLEMLMTFYYPLENLRYTGILGYYRQREWRISANMTENGVPLARPINAAEKDLLLGLDKAFFMRRIRFAKGTYRSVDTCEFYERFEERPIIQYVRRVIVPSIAVAKARDILSEPTDPPVVALEALKHVSRKLRSNKVLKETPRKRGAPERRR